MNANRLPLNEREKTASSTCQLIWGSENGSSTRKKRCQEEKNEIKIQVKFNTKARTKAKYFACTLSFSRKSMREKCAAHAMFPKRSIIVILTADTIK